MLDARDDTVGVPVGGVRDGVRVCGATVRGVPVGGVGDRVALPRGGVGVRVGGSVAARRGGGGSGRVGGSVAARVGGSVAGRVVSGRGSLPARDPLAFVIPGSDGRDDDDMARTSGGLSLAGSGSVHAGGATGAEPTAAFASAGSPGASPGMGASAASLPSGLPSPPLNSRVKIPMFANRSPPGSISFRVRESTALQQCATVFDILSRVASYLESVSRDPERRVCLGCSSIRAD